MHTLKTILGASLILVMSLDLTAAVVDLAAHKPCRLTPKPNYPRCTDAQDDMQLTDGIHAGSDWLKTGTVGWQHAASSPTIDIDLGAVYPIESVDVFTIGGGSANVEFPDNIVVLVGSGHNFTLAGVIDSVGLERNAGIKKSIKMSSGPLRSQGRHVRLIVQPGGRYVFLDEVQVWGQDSPVAIEAETDLPGITSSTQAMQLADRLQDVKVLATRTDAALAGVAAPPAAIQTAREMIQKATDALTSTTDSVSSAERIDTSKQRIFQARGDVLRAQFGRQVLVLPAAPMAMLLEADWPDTTGFDKPVELTCCRHEYSAAAINVINCSSRPLRLQVQAPVLLDPNHDQAADLKIDLREVQFVTARQVGSLGDALVLLGQRPLELLPGQMKQLWLDVWCGSAAPAAYRGHLSLRDDTLDQQPISSQIEVRLQVEPLQMPEQLDVHSKMAAYFDAWPLVVGHEKEAARDMRDHYTNVVVLRANMVSMSSTAPYHFDKLDEMVALFGAQMQYSIYLGFTAKKLDSGIFGTWMTPSWQAAFGQWLKALVAHFHELGVGYDGFLLSPLDETLCAEFYQICEQIKTIDPQVRIYANSFGDGPQSMRRFAQLVDVWGLHDDLSSRYPKWLEAARELGGELWTYQEAGPGKANDPYSYYRLLSWRAFQRGQTGVGFWVYSDVAEAPYWDDSGSARGWYGVIYGRQGSPVDSGGEAIIPSRRWQAYREGLEDYQFLAEYRKIVAICRAVQPQAARRAEEQMTQAIQQVVRHPGDVTMADRTRRELMTTLVELVHYITQSYGGDAHDTQRPGQKL